MQYNINGKVKKVSMEVNESGEQKWNSINERVHVHLLQVSMCKTATNII